MTDRSVQLITNRSATPQVSSIPNLYSEIIWITEWIWTTESTFCDGHLLNVFWLFFFFGVQISKLEH